MLQPLLDRIAIDLVGAVIKRRRLLPKNPNKSGARNPAIGRSTDPSWNLANLNRKFSAIQRACQL